MPALYPLRRRSPFAPYDPNDPQATVEDQGSMYGPTAAPPPPPPQQGPPSMFTPAPTGPMPDFSRSTSDVSQSKPLDMNAMPKIPPALSDQSKGIGGGIREQSGPRQYTANDPEVKANMGPIDRLDGAKRLRVAQMMSEESNRAYMAGLAGKRLEQEAGYYKNVPRYGTPQVQEIEGIRRRVAAPMTGEGEPYIYPGEVPEDPRMFETTKEPSVLDIWRQQNPGKPISDFIKLQHEREPAPVNPSFSQMQVDLTDGRKNVPANYNSKTGKYSLPTGEDITALVAGTSRVAPGQNPAVEAAIEEAAQSAAKYDLTALKDMTVFRGDNRTLVFGRARQINPQFNSSELDRRIKMMDDVTNGKTGLNIQSLGTFLEHAGELADVIRGISQSNTPALNRPLNWWRRNLAGSPDLQRLETAIEPVGKEFESFLLNNRALYDQDRKDIGRLLDPAMSPAQILATLTQMGRTVNARYNEMNTRFKRTVGGKNIHDMFPETFSPEAADAAQKIGIKLIGGPSGGGGGTAGVTFKYTATDANGQKVGSNDGKTWTPIK